MVIPILWRVYKYVHVSWLFIKKPGSLRALLAFLNIAERCAKYTKTGLDDMAIYFLASYIREEIKNLTHLETQILVKKINATKNGVLKDIEIKIDSKKDILIGKKGEAKIKYSLPGREKKKKDSK